VQNHHAHGRNVRAAEQSFRHPSSNHARESAEPTHQMLPEHRQTTGCIRKCVEQLRACCGMIAFENLVKMVRMITPIRTDSVKAQFYRLRKLHKPAFRRHRLEARQAETHCCISRRPLQSTRDPAMKAGPRRDCRIVLSRQFR